MQQGNRPHRVCAYEGLFLLAWQVQVRTWVSKADGFTDRCHMQPGLVSCGSGESRVSSRSSSTPGTSATWRHSSATSSGRSQARARAAKNKGRRLRGVIVPCQATELAYQSRSQMMRQRCSWITRAIKKAAQVVMAYQRTSHLAGEIVVAQCVALETYRNVAMAAIVLGVGEGAEHPCRGAGCHGLVRTPCGIPTAA